MSKILLGYNPLKQVDLAMWRGTVLTCDNSDRACEIINGLYDVSEKIPPNEPILLDTDENGIEVAVVVTSPWMRSVEYSDQAWNDLLSVATERLE